MSDYTPPINTKLADIGEDEKVLLRKLSSLRQEAEEYKKTHLKRHDTASEEDDLKLYRGEVGPKDRFFDGNFVQAFIDRMVAQLTDNRPTLRVEHRKVGLKSMAKVLEKAIHAVWQESDLQRQSYKMCHNAAVTRSSGIYTGYDPTTDDIYFEVLRQDQVLCDPIVNEAGLMDRGEYVFIKRTKPLSELRVRFPGRGALVKPDSSLVHVNRGARVVDSPVTELVRSTGTKAVADAIPRAEVWEGLIKDRQQDLAGKFLFPTYRHIIHTKDLILSDMPLAYWDGRIPLDWFDWAVDPEHPWGISAPSLMRRLQLSFNQVMDGTVENTLISNFIQVIGDYDAIEPQRWKELQKIRSSLILRKTGQNKTITVLPPPVYGADKVMLAKTLFNFAQLLMGVTDVTMGESPGSLQSGVAVEGLQESANLMTRARASRLEDFFSRVGNKAISRILQFMTCVDAETECLTKRGWIKFDQFNEDDEIYTLDPQTRCGVWSPLLALNVHEYSGEMYEIKGRKIDALVTPNHKWAVSGNESVARRNNGAGAFRFVETRDLKSWHCFPAGAPIDETNAGLNGDADWAELLGWVVTEGYYSIDGRWSKTAKWQTRVCVYQSEKANPEKCEMIRQCLNRNKVEWREYDVYDGMRRFTFIGEAAQRMVAMFPDKVPTWEYIVGLNRESLHRLYTSMILGDGCSTTTVAGRANRNTQYFTTNFRLADIMQAVATLLGYSTRQWQRVGARGGTLPRLKPHDNSIQVFRISEGIMRPGITWARLQKHARLVQYTGIVWCPTTVTGTWLARRHGRVYVTGNSDRVFSFLGPTGEAFEYAMKRQELFLGDDGKHLSDADRRDVFKYLRFSVLPGSSAPGTRANRAKMMMELNAIGAASRKMVLNAADFPDPDQMLKEAEEDFQKFPPPGFLRDKNYGK